MQTNTNRDNAQMNLILWRHAEAEEGDISIDLKRNLTRRGHKQAAAMADEPARLGGTTELEARIAVLEERLAEHDAEASTRAEDVS